MILLISFIMSVCVFVFAAPWPAFTKWQTVLLTGAQTLRLTTAGLYTTLGIGSARLG